MKITVKAEVNKALYDIHQDELKYKIKKNLKIYLSYILLLNIIIFMSCSEKVVIEEIQNYNIEIDTIYSYKVKSRDNTMYVRDDWGKYNVGDTIKIYK